jgi:CheY-like chemotaxis protein
MSTNKTATKLRIVIADDHPSIRENLRYLVNAEVDFEVVGVAKDGVSALQMALALRPDVLVLDYSLPDYDGLSVARAVRSGGSRARVILYTMNTEAIAHADRSVVDACVSKDASPALLLDSIRGHRAPAQRRQRVLVVEDDPEIRGVMRAALEDDGLEIIETGDGFEALAECERQAPGVVVLDLGLPHMSGEEFVTAYRRLKTPEAPIVVVSARSGGQRIADELGAAAFVAKPFSIQALSETVRRVSATHPHATA